MSEENSVKFSARNFDFFYTRVILRSVTISLPDLVCLFNVKFNFKVGLWSDIFI